MSVTPFTLFVENPEPVLGWLSEHGTEHVVRKQAKQIASGWSMKVALDDPYIADLFRCEWRDVLVTLENQQRWLQEGRFR